jgi:MSHA biogenesis protein MshL
MIKSFRIIAGLAVLLFLTPACGPRPIATTAAHFQEQAVRPEGDIPSPVRQPVVLPPPKPMPKTELYSVVVSDVPVRELLFSLARDAGLNVDIHPNIAGRVSMNAIDQTLPQILHRISNQVDLRYELDGPNLVLLPDTPYLKMYTVDYVNIARDMTSSISVADQVASAGAGNVSETKIVNLSVNRFWERLEQNVRDILNEPVSTSTMKADPPKALKGADTVAHGPPEKEKAPTESAAVRQHASVVANPENGILYVRATARQHAAVQEFLGSVLRVARRQVLIEATVVEVQLSDRYQQGIDWQILRNKAEGLNLVFQPQGPQPLPTGATPGGSYSSPILADGNPIFGSGYPALLLTNLNSTLSGLNASITATVSLLESFGNVKVLSSPRLSVLNNQTALLKVVDNRVYFTIDVEVTPATTTTLRIETYTSTVNTVPEGFVMTVTPQIDANDTITLSLRPSITRVIGFVKDPNPTLARAGVTSMVPEVQTREMESVLKVHNGDLSVMGGLMQDRIDHKVDGVPVLSGIPLLGELFKYRNEAASKSELVIFLRPVVIKDPAIEGDYKGYGRFLPSDRFFEPEKWPSPRETLGVGAPLGGSP